MAPSASRDNLVVLSFAKMLKQAYTGDVEFVFKNGQQGGDGGPLKLYAFRHILEGVDTGSPESLDFSRTSPPIISPRFLELMALGSVEVGCDS